MKAIKIFALSVSLIMATTTSLGQLNGQIGLLGTITGLPVISGRSGNISDFAIIGGLLDLAVGLDRLESLPFINLSPLLSLESGIPIVERLPVVTRIPIVGELIGDGKGPDPISLIGEVIGLENLPLTVLFDGSIPL